MGLAYGNSQPIMKKIFKKNADFKRKKNKLIKKGDKREQNPTKKCPSHRSFFWAGSLRSPAQNSFQILIISKLKGN